MTGLMKDMNLGFRNVIRSWKQFIPFFVAAIIVQSLFISIFTVGYSVDRHYRKSISEDFSYHYILEGMDDNTYVLFHNTLKEFDPIEGETAKEIKHETYSINGGTAHRYYITLNYSNYKAETNFKKTVAAIEAEAPCSFTITPSPLTVVNTYLASNRITIAALTLLSFTISVFLLVSVYSVRISYYRFMYGVYMTCGAGYAKLVGMAIFEMLTVFLLTFFPSVLISVLTVILIFRNTAMSLAFGIHMLLFAVIMSVAVILCAVGVPMKKISMEMPIDLINKSGTAEHVISPRRSKKLFGKSFPFFYELLSIFRFSKYYLVTLSVCVVFSSLFITGIYAGELNDQVAEIQTGTLALTCPGGFDDEELLEISELENVDYLMWDESIESVRLLSFLKTSKEQNINSLGSVEYNESFDATFDAKITFFDELMINTLINNHLAEFEGDPYDILENDGIPRVIISKDISNVDRYDFKVGDTVTLYVCTDNTFSIPEKYTATNSDILEYCVDYSKTQGTANGNESIVYLPIEFQICALIDYAAPSSSLVFAVNAQTYESVAAIENRLAKRVSVDVCTGNDITTDEESALFDSVSRIISVYRDWNVRRTFNALRNKLSDETYILGIFIVMAIFMLMGLPLMWLFSQKVFYEKRDNEIELIRCLGANEKNLFLLYLTDGVALAVIALVFTCVFSVILSAIIFGIVTLILPFFNIEGVWKLKFHISPISVAVSAATCMLCGFMAAMFAYLKGRRLRVRKEKEYLSSRKDV